MNELRSWFRRSDRPITIAVIVAAAAVTAAAWIARSFEPTLTRFVSIGSGWLFKPWTIVTYPFTPAYLGGLLGLVFFAIVLYWLYVVCGTVEGEVGSDRFAWYMLGLTAAGGMALGLVCMTLKIPVLYSGPEIIAASSLALWATRHPGMMIQVWFFPIQLRWLAAIVAALIAVEYGGTNPLVGLSACVPMGAAWLLASDRIPGITYAAPRKSKMSKQQRQREAAFFDDVKKRMQEREEKERLRRLFERSFDDEGPS